MPFHFFGLDDAVITTGASVERALEETDPPNVIVRAVRFSPAGES